MTSIAQAAHSQTCRPWVDGKWIVEATELKLNRGTKTIRSKKYPFETSAMAVKPHSERLTPAVVMPTFDQPIGTDPPSKTLAERSSTRTAR
jgi:hypothetical protein